MDLSAESRMHKTVNMVNFPRPAFSIAVRFVFELTPDECTPGSDLESWVHKLISL